MKAVVAAFNQEKALVGAFSVLTNLRMELFQALALTALLPPTPPDCRGRAASVRGDPAPAGGRGRDGGRGWGGPAGEVHPQQPRQGGAGAQPGRGLRVRHAQGGDTAQCQQHPQLKVTPILILIQGAIHLHSLLLIFPIF